MKVLFASLSRIGDYLQHLVVIRSWSLQNPDIEVHILVNDLIPEDLRRMNSEFLHIELPRFGYQNRINHVSTPLLYPFWDLKKIVRRLRDEKYIQLFDLTYQSHSLAFLKLVQPGFSYSEAEVLRINEYLNWDDQGHLVDKIKAVHGLSVEPEMADGRAASKVFLQITSSDPKKNIDWSRWRTLLDGLKGEHRHVSFMVLASRQEQKDLRSVFSDSELFVANFSELQNAFDPETRLVSLDTSIKHFATRSRVPTTELSVGSSHWIKNAAYQSGNYVFSAEFHCRPCMHSKACPLGRNQCQDQIDFKRLQEFIGHWIGDFETSSYPMKTSVRDSNLCIQRGDKWNQKINQTNAYL